MEDKEPFRVRDFLPRIRYFFKQRKWIIPLPFAVGGFLLGFLIAPVSAKGDSPDKMTAAFVALLAAGIAIAVVVFAFQRDRFQRLKPGLVVIYAICAVGAPLVGVLPGLPDSFYGHLWGAPLVLGVAVAGIVGILLTCLVAWMWTRDRSR